MELQRSTKKPDTGLLPGYENILTTTGGHPDIRKNHESVMAEFCEHHKKLQRLIDQSAAIAPDDFVKELVELLQNCLDVDFLWVADLDLPEKMMTNVYGYSTIRGEFGGRLALYPTSPILALSEERCVSYPCNALVCFGDSPYLQKFNINAFILHRIDQGGQS